MKDELERKRAMTITSSDKTMECVAKMMYRMALYK